MKGDMLRRLRRIVARQPEVEDELRLISDVASVYIHPEGQQMWWESYNRRDAAGKRELAESLRRKI